MALTIEDKLAIHELLTQLYLELDGHRPDGFASFFTADGVFNAYGEFKGREAIAGFVKEHIRKGNEAENRCAAGAYELVAADGDAQVSLFASGSEVSLAVDAQKVLAGRGIATRVVSVPCFELLFEASPATRRAVIGNAPVKVGIEAAVRQGWDAIIGTDGAFVGMTSFGASAPAKDLYRHFGITVDKIVEAAMR